MGKRGPKSKFTDVACPNEACKDHGVTGRETLWITVHIKQETQQFADISATVAGKRSAIVQILFTAIFAKTNLPSI